MNCRPYFSSFLISSSSFRSARAVSACARMRAISASHSSAKLVRTVRSEGAGEGRGARLSLCEKTDDFSFTEPPSCNLQGV